MTGKSNLSNKIKIALVSVICGYALFFTFTLILAAPPGSPYEPGETLNPTCAPTDANCTVRTPATGNGTSTQIAFWSASSSLISNPSLTFTSSTSQFLFSGSNFSVASTTTSTALVFMQGKTAASTTLLISGFGGQTANFLAIASSSGREYFTVSVFGVASSTEFRSPSSTIGTLTVTSCVGCGGGGGGVTTSSLPLPTYLALFTGVQEITGSSSLTYTSSTLLFQNFGISSSTQLVSPSSTITNLRGTDLMVTSSTATRFNAIGATSTNLQVATKLIADYSTASRCARFDADKQLVAATGDCASGGSGGVTTSTTGTYLSGNLAFFTDSLTLNATNTLNISTSTGAFQYFGLASTTQFISPSSTITTLRGTSLLFTSSTIGTSTAATNALLTIATTSPLFTVLDDGRIGVGTAQPSSTLHVLGLVNQANNLFSISSSTGNAYFTINSGGRIMIATSTLATSTALLTIATSTPILTVLDGGNVGIGTNYPAATSTLMVKGLTATNGTAGLMVTNSNNATVLVARNDGLVGINTNTLDGDYRLEVSGIGVFWGGGTSYALSVDISTTQTISYRGTNDTALSFGYNSSLGAGSATETMRLTATNLVGIGTATPSSTLHIASSSVPAVSIGTTGSSGKNYSLRVGGVAAQTFDIYDLASSTSRLTIDTTGRIMLATTTIATSSALLTIATTTARLFTVMDTGRVMIAGTSSLGVLHVENANGSEISAFFGDSDTGGVGDSIYFKGETINAGYSFNGSTELILNHYGSFGDTNQFRDLLIRDGKGGTKAVFYGATGNAVIGGRTAPSSTLHVFNGASSSSIAISAPGNKVFQLRVGGVTSSTFDIFDNASGTTRFGINTAGQIFIATTTAHGATSTLTVCAFTNCTRPTEASSTDTVAFFASTDGTTAKTSIVARGVITGGLADIGEYIKVVGDESEYEAGDVLSASALEAVRFEKSNTAYDYKLAGVITETAGLIAGGGDDARGNKVIALAGRVPVKVSTVNGPIRKGDYLTSSDIPGVAVKAIEPGPVLGMALEDYSGSPSTGSGPTTSSPAKVMTFIDVHWALPPREDGGGRLLAALGNFAEWIKIGLKDLGITVSDGVVRMKELAVDRIFAKRVVTEELCLEDICITKNDLRRILDNANIQAIISDISQPVVSPSTSSGDTEAELNLPNPPPVVEEPSGSAQGEPEQTLTTTFESVFVPEPVPALMSEPAPISESEPAPEE